MAGTLLKTLLLWTICVAAAAAAQPYKPKAGPFEIETRLDTWTDPDRQRDIPLKLYLPRGGDEPAPLVIFSHGLGGSREAAVYLGNHWASHGYACVFVQHPGSDEAVWRDLPQQEVMPAMRRAVADPRNAVNRPLDVRFVLDRLETLNRDDPLLAGRLDMQRIGMAGHSFGAWTTQAIAGQRFAAGLRLSEPRVRAGVLLSPVARPGEPADGFAGIRLPLLHLTGTLDSSAINDTGPQHRRIPFDQITADHQYLVILDGADHMVFNGHPRIGPRSRRDAHHHAQIRQITTAFWDAHLLGDENALNWLEQGLMEVLGEGDTTERK